MKSQDAKKIEELEEKIQTLMYRQEEFPKMEKNAKPNLKTWFPPGQDRPDGPLWWNGVLKELLNKYNNWKLDHSPLHIL